ncbi:MAG TPA: mycofactocin-coupled SDR family oxidoreductase [Sporichthya sp.]|nr:mycofactocin-coupled SDR family oxidoreductase [Sporichthya sp.]
MNISLAGKVAFVTGAARGQGRSHAIHLARAGADIIGLDLCAGIDTVGYPPATFDDLAETVDLVEAEDSRMVAAVADVRDRDAVESALATGLDEFGRVDLVIANAGILPIVGDQADTFQAYLDAVDVNLTGVFHTVDACLPKLIEQGTGGSIVITSSTSGLTGLVDGSRGSMGYAAAKHGVVGLMRGWAAVLAKHSIRVNTIHPTGVNSPMVVNDAFTAYVEVEHPEMIPRLQNAMPVALIEPADVSAAVVWLCSDAARYVTGVALPVDAGYALA